MTGPASAQAEQGRDGAGDGGVALLDDFVNRVQDLSADFEQSLLDAEGGLIEAPATGRFTLLRPDRFRWHYRIPDELLIVADGEWIWHYDVLLEQAERRPLSDLAASPAMLLGGAESIADRFEIRELPAADGLRWLELEPPASDDSGFSILRLGFADGLPVVLELVDNLDQLTRVSFSHIEVNTGLDPDGFDFTPPSGVTVIGDDD